MEKFENSEYGREYILDYGVDLMTKSEGLSLVSRKILNGEGAQIVTINPEMIEMGNKDENLAKILKNADLVIPDGVGIKIALRLRGIKQEQVAGIELARELIDICADNDYPVAFVGAQEEVVNRAVENIKKETPNLDIVYKHNGYFDDEDVIITELLEKKPKVVFVALGVPRQEFFIEKVRTRKDDIILIGVGGSFDVWSGFTKRAPKIWQKLGLEWLYRTIKQPERFKRIFPTLPLFLFKVIIETAQLEKEVDE